MMPVVQDLLDTLKQMEELHRKKNDDYANSSNPFSNFDDTARGLSLFQHSADQAFAWPIYNKLSRLANLLNSDRLPNNESIEDSFVDIAVYVLLWKAHIKGRSVKTDKIRHNFDYDKDGNRLKLGEINDSTRANPETA
jgi:hypothetical protein